MFSLFRRPVIAAAALVLSMTAQSTLAATGPAGKDLSRSLASVTVTAPTLVKGAGTTFTVAINLSDPSNAGVGSYQFGLDYDPTIINPSGANAGCSNSGTLGGNAGQSVTCNTQTTADPHTSTLLVSDFGSTATTGSSPPPLLNVTFVATATGPFPKTSTLHFHDVFFFTLAAPLTVTPVDGSVQITGTTAANVTVAGRVLDASGHALRGARVVLTDSHGVTFTATTNAFGRYSFASVPSGGLYTASVAVRGLVFAPRVINLKDAVSNLDLTPR